MSGVCNFTNIEAWAIISFFLPPKAAKDIHAILTETLGEHAPFYTTIVCHHHNWMAEFKHGDFYTCDAPRPGRLKTMTTTEINDQIYELILEDRRPHFG
jgi:hypothetical protein